VHELQTNLTIFTHPFVAIENGSMMVSNGRYFHTREALAGDVAHPQPRHKARSCSALEASPALGSSPKPIFYRVFHIEHTIQVKPDSRVQLCRHTAKGLLFYSIKTSNQTRTNSVFPMPINKETAQ
jgi:hypothetical protein